MTTSVDSAQLDPCKLDAQDFPDIQGLIVRGYNLPQVRHFVLTIGDAATAVSFLDALTSGTGALSITSAAPWPGGAKPPYALNLGLTATGLEALCLPKADVSFNPYNFQSFLGGAVAAAGTVGDTGKSAPSDWLPKLNAAQAGAAHLLLSLYTNGDADREKYSTILRTMFSDVIPVQGHPNRDVLEFDVDALTTTDASGRKSHKIHFGYTDGISNPIIDAEGLPPLRPMQLPYVPAWQFVLRNGTMTSYNMPTPLPLAQNASFSAFRILEQNVEAFDAFLEMQGGNAAQELLAAKMCGRWRNGNPLVASPDGPGDKELPDDQLRDFDYGTDIVGDPCPYSAHTRRVNPRGGPGVVGVHNTPSGRQQHRIMRRANAYGPVYPGRPDGKSRGLAGHFIGASLFDQFEFLMSQWVNSGAFAGSRAQAASDPLLAAVPPDSTFTYWAKGKPVAVPSLSRFVTTRGGMYCLLPSLTGIRWMAANGDSPDPWKIILPPRTF